MWQVLPSRTQDPQRRGGRHKRVWRGCLQSPAAQIPHNPNRYPTIRTRKSRGRLVRTPWQWRLGREPHADQVLPTGCSHVGPGGYQGEQEEGGSRQERWGVLQWNVYLGHPSPSLVSITASLTGQSAHRAITSAPIWRGAQATCVKRIN